MVRPEDIGSLTDFTRNTKAHLKRLRRTGRPNLLTVNGKAQVVVQSASAYQRLLESLGEQNQDARTDPGQDRVGRKTKEGFGGTNKLQDVTRRKRS
jgi:PHD/YefM family antitoxin component YafN of YafNO toxin-antitoxin module